MDITEYKRVIRPMLGDYRFHHSVCVSEAAVELAKLNGADEDKAQMAGILHDIMKDLSHKEQLGLMKKYGIELTAVEANAPKLWHAMLAPAYIKDVLGVNDTEILNAVRYHTTGRGGMSLLEKIVFTADFISADRSYDEVEKFRKLAKKSLTKAMHAELAYTVSDLAGEGVPVHPDTVTAYNEISLEIIKLKKDKEDKNK